MPGRCSLRITFYLVTTAIIACLTHESRGAKILNDKWNQVARLKPRYPGNKVSSLVEFREYMLTVCFYGNSFCAHC